MIISVASLKGGCGKTTVAINLAVGFAHMGKKVTIVDADTNQSCLSWSSYRSPELPQIPVFGLPDSNALVPNVKALSETNDIVIIDGTPALSKLTSRILLVADQIVIPTLPGILDTWATQKFMEHYWTASDMRGDIIPACFVGNRWKKTTIAGDIYRVLGKTDLKVMDTTLSDRVAYNRAVMNGQGVFELGEPKTKQEITRFFNEFQTLIG